MSFMLVHEDPNSPDYVAKKRICEYLAERLASRITRLYGELWGVHKGGVPSGCFNTSHMDSWIMGLYFFLFCTWQLSQCPVGDREELEQAVLDAMIVIYGDDHVYNRGTGIGATYLSGVQFSAFMKQYFDVDIRDVYDGISYLTKVHGGRVSRRGACFLKHYFVENEHYKVDKKQAPFIPYRETFDFIVRAVWGKEVKDRDLFDVLLSVIGHSYGTYASNHEAYIALRTIYEELFVELGMTTAETMPEILQRLGNTDIRRIRQQGLTKEDVLNGFPSWDELIRRNEWRAEEHDIATTAFDHDWENFD